MQTIAFSQAPKN